MIGYTDKWTCMQLLFLPIPLAVVKILLLPWIRRNRKKQY